MIAKKEEKKGLGRPASENHAKCFLKLILLSLPYMITDVSARDLDPDSVSWSPGTKKRAGGPARFRVIEASFVIMT